MGFLKFGKLFRVALIAVFSLSVSFTSLAYTNVADVRMAALLGEDMSYHIGDSLGSYKLTGYCSCAKCNGVWVGYPTRLGTPLEKDLTIAVDKSVIPLGAYVWLSIKDVGWRLYQAQDTGSGVGGKHIDVFVGDNHGDCYQERFNTITEVRAYVQ